MDKNRRLIPRKKDSIAGQEWEKGREKGSKEQIFKIIRDVKLERDSKKGSC